MKIVHLTSASSGGAFVAAQRLHEQLIAEGIESNHLVFTGKQGINYTLWASNPIKKMWALGLHALEKLDFLRYEKSKKLRFRFSHGLTGIAIWKNPLVMQADIIHIHWVNKGFINLHGLRKLIDMGKPIFWTTHDLWPFTGGFYHLAPAYMENGMSNKKLMQLSQNLFDKKMNMWGNGQIIFIAPSHWLAEQVANLMPKAHIEIIKNGVDCNTFKINTTKKKEERTLKLGFVAANLGDKNKNIGDFFAIADLLYTQKLKIECHVVGNADKLEIKPLCPLIQYGEIHANQKMVDFYNEIDAVLCTSLMENLPTTLIEAQSCGTPAFAYNVGGVAEIIPNANMAPQGNMEQLAKAINNYFTNTNFTAEQVRQGILNDFCLGENVKKTIELYGTQIN